MTSPGTLDERVTGSKFSTPQHPRVAPLSVRTVLQRSPAQHLYIQEEAPLLEALALMVEHELSAILVLDGERLSGLFSEHDYLRLLTRNASMPTVREAMSVCDYIAHLEDRVQDCLTRMFEKKMSHLVVVDESSSAVLIPREVLLREMIVHLELIHREIVTDQQVMFLRGTYSC
ncbi:MAG: CBS domain-containing protein [Betaproteobacteria bacterium]